MAGPVPVKAGAAQTNGLLSVFEGRLPPRSEGPPMHVHTRDDEAMYVLEGELVVRLGDETHRVAAGSFVWMPRDVPHGFSNASDVPVRVLGIGVPGGIEELLAAVRPDGELLPADELAAIVERFGGRHVGPPVPVS
jgi:mannose-6-phosphate isomerase-like protein (cupin superfamily)